MTANPDSTGRFAERYSVLPMADSRESGNRAGSLSAADLSTNVESLGRSFTPQPVLRPRQQVENQMRQAILDGTFVHGDRLPSENQLAEIFSVSRSTVREALRSLVEAGLILKGPGATGGSFMQRVDHHTLSKLVFERLGSILVLGTVTHAEVAAFRDVLEVPCARLAATNRTEANLATLHYIIETEKQTTFDDPRIPHLNAEFHSELAEASGNRVMASFVSALHRIAHPLAFINTSAEFGKVAVRHHIDIYVAVERGDPEGATRAMHKHLDYLDANAH